MKKLTFTITISFFVFFLIALIGSTSSAAPSNTPKPPASACYAFDNFPTDFIILKIVPGNGLVTGTYRQCITGADPGTGSADAVMVGSIQDVGEASAIPPDNILTQIALVGSISSGNLGDGPDKASQCWLHLLFSDNNMTTGHAIGACGWISGDFDLQPEDRFNEPIHQIDCKDVLSLPATPGGECTVP
jgi:hypothetical protein